MKRHIWKIILLVLVVVIAVAVIVVLVNANRNRKAMNTAADRAIALLQEAYTLTPVDCSAFDGLKIYGIMGFNIQQFQAEGFGNICVIKADCGLMQMLTLCITPTQVDMPLMSVDYMYILGNRTAYVEVYDLPLEDTDAYRQAITSLQTIAGDFTGLADTVPTPGWYDDIRPAGSYKKVTYQEDGQLLTMLEKYLMVYLMESRRKPELSQEQTAAKAAVMESYSHRLISEGGISTDAFKESLGEDKTREFFDQVMFGTGRYKA